jgi:hypothetical protein
MFSLTDKIMESALADIATYVGYSLIATNAVAYPLKFYYKHFSSSNMSREDARCRIVSAIPTPFEIGFSYFSSILSDSKRSNKK